MWGVEPETDDWRIKEDTQVVETFKQTVASILSGTCPDDLEISINFHVVAFDRENRTLSRALTSPHCPGGLKITLIPHPNCTLEYYLAYLSRVLSEVYQSRNCPLHLQINTRDIERSFNVSRLEIVMQQRVKEINIKGTHQLCAYIVQNTQHIPVLLQQIILAYSLDVAPSTDPSRFLDYYFDKKKGIMKQKNLPPMGFFTKNECLEKTRTNQDWLTLAALILCNGYDNTIYSIDVKQKTALEGRELNIHFSGHESARLCKERLFENSPKIRSRVENGSLILKKENINLFSIEYLGLTPSLLFDEEQGSCSPAR